MFVHDPEHYCTAILPWHSRELILNHIHFLYISAANLKYRHRLLVGPSGVRIFCCMMHAFIRFITRPWWSFRCLSLFRSCLCLFKESIENLTENSAPYLSLSFFRLGLVTFFIAVLYRVHHFYFLMTTSLLVLILVQSGFEPLHLSCCPLVVLVFWCPNATTFFCVSICALSKFLFL